MTAPVYLTVAEAAAALRVTRMSVYRMVHAGELTAVRIGPKTIRILAADFFDQYPEAKEAFR